MQAASAPFGVILAGNDMVVENELDLMLVDRTNLCATPNFEHATVGSWVGGPGVTPTISSTVHLGAEAHSLRLGYVNGSAADTNAVMYSFATVPGQSYTVKAQIFVATGNPAARFSIYGVVATGTLSTNAWNDMGLQFTASHNWATLRISNDVTVSSTLFGCNITDVMIEKSLNIGSYFDGDTAGCDWQGTPGNSVSLLNLLPFPDATLALESAAVSREITTDMPDGTRDIAGYTAATGTFVVSGYLDPNDLTQTPAALFSPYNTGSVLYRGDAADTIVTSKSGLYTGSSKTPEMLTNFTGVLDDYDYDPITGAVTLTCIDFRNKLKTAPTLPSFSGLPSPTALNTFTPFLTAHYGLDYILRAGGIYSSPPPRPGSMFFASMHGSIWPEISDGVLGVGPIASGLNPLGTPATTPVWGQGKWSPQTFAGPFGTYARLKGATPHPSPIQAGVAFGSCYMEWTGYWDPSKSTVGETYLQAGGGLTPSVTNNTYQLSVGTNSSGNLNVTAGYTPFNLSGVGTTQSLAITPSNSAGWFTIGAQFFWSTANVLNVWIYVNNAAVSTTALTYSGGHTSAGFTDVDGAYLRNSSAQILENICISPEMGANNYPSANFTPGAYLDASLNDALVALPDVTGQDSWQVIQEICGAETAVGGFDELGVFRFYNRVTLRGVANTGTLDGAVNLKGSQIGVKRSTIATHVQVPVNAISVQPPSAIWTASTVLYVDPSTQRLTFNVVLSSPAVNVALTDSGFTPSGGGTPGLTTYRASSTADGTGIAATVTVTVVQLSPTELQITVFNQNVFGVYLVTPAGYVDTPGTPALTIGGQSVSALSNPTDLASQIAAGTIADWQWPPLGEGGAAANPRGEILLQVGGNPWQQNYNTALRLAGDIGTDLEHPRPLIENVDVVYDPRMQLTDRRTLNLTDQGINGDVSISGIHIDAVTWDQTLVVRAVARPGGWILGDPVYSILGTTTYA